MTNSTKTSKQYNSTKMSNPYSEHDKLENLMQLTQAQHKNLMFTTPTGFMVSPMTSANKQPNPLSWLSDMDPLTLVASLVILLLLLFIFGSIMFRLIFIVVAIFLIYVFLNGLFKSAK